LPTVPSFVAPSFQKGVMDHNSDFKILNGNDLPGMYIVYKFGDPVAPEITR